MSTPVRAERWSSLLCKLVTLVLVCGCGARHVDPYTGTWHLDLDRSGGEPRTQTLSIQVRDNTETYRSEMVWPNGRRQITTYTAGYDGGEYPSTTVIAEPGGKTAQREDVVVLKRLDAARRERYWHQGGRLVRILRREISPDGRTLTSQLVDVDEAGNESAGPKLVFERSRR